MKIQLGKILMNKTVKYITPLLLNYGDEFLKEYNKLFKLAIGIGDIALTDRNIYFQKHIFILCDVTKTAITNTQYKNSSSFYLFLDYIRNKEFYEADYEFDNLVNGHQHMIVLKLSSEFDNILEQFKDSNYHSMYTMKEIEKLFKNNVEVTKILKKDNNYKLEFVNKLNKEYLTTIKPYEWEHQLDYPIDIKQEIFNKNE